MLRQLFVGEKPTCAQQQKERRLEKLATIECKLNVTLADADGQMLQALGMAEQ